MPRRSKKEHSEPNLLIAIIEKNFPYRGRIECKFLWAEGGVSRYRLNWYSKTWESSLITESISNSEFIRVYDNGRIFRINGTHFKELLKT